MIESSQLRFKLTPEEIRNQTHTSFDEVEKAIAAIEELPESKISADNTLLALESLLSYFNNELSVPIFLKYVSPDPAVRQAADETETRAQKFSVDLFVREKLFLKLKNLDTSKLSPKAKYLHDEYLIQFKRNGLDLPEEKRKTFVEKKKQLVEAESTYQQNLLKENDFLLFTASEMEGCPQSFIDGLEKVEGKFKVTLAYPHYNPFMENAKDSEAKKRLEYRFQRRGGEKNKELLETAIRLRQELASLLGFKNHAEYVLSRRMAKNSQQVSQFLSDLQQKLQRLAKEELQELLSVKKTHSYSGEAVHSYEWRYLDNLQRKKKYDYDPHEVQQYFPLHKVTQGLFEIYEKVFGVKFEEDKTAEVWHPSVQKFRVHDGKKTLSWFFMDLFPREGKYGHAAAFTIQSGFDRNGKYHEPVSSIVANFSPPVGKKPSLLLHGEVETFFHEFGHILHQVLTQAQYATFSGTNVKTDFVEAPSQMMENWAWDPGMLKKMSGHYETHQPLPDSLIERLLKSKNLNVGLRYLRQVAFATYDLEIHQGRPVHTTEAYASKMKEIMMIPIQPGTFPEASFGHLMGGYDCGYYGYLWSEVFAEDMFTRFKKEGILSEQAGRDFRKWILEPGGEVPPEELIRGFLKRAPNSEAFLAGLGLQ